MIVPYILLIKDGSIASVVPTRHSLIAILSGGFVGIRLLGLASFSFSVNISRNDVLLLFFLRALHLLGEFPQVSQQTMVGETECLHLVTLACRVSRASLGGRLFRSPCWSCALGGLA